MSLRDPAKSGRATLRESTTTSGSFVWNRDFTRYPHTGIDPDGNTFPEVEINRPEEGLTFRFDDTDRYLYRYYGQPVTQGYLATEISSHSFDGEELVSHSRRRDVAAGQFIIHASQDVRDFQEFNNASLLPFLFAFRPMAGGRLSEELDLELVVEEAADGEAPAVKLIVWEENNHRVYELDPEHQYRLVRHLWYTDSTRKEVASGQLRTEVTVDSYHDDTELGSQVPRTWHTVHRTHDGRKSHEMSSETTSYELNQPYDRDDFTLRPFPAGAIILDEATGKVGVQQKDGSIKWGE